MTPYQQTVDAEAKRCFEDDLDAIPEADTPLSPNHITELLVRFNAAVRDPATQSIGGFAQTLQAIQGELYMMAGSLGVAVPGSNYDVDWEEILAAADAMAGHDEKLVDFTQDELAVLTVRSRYD